MRFALRRLPHVRLCTLRQIVLAQSQWHPFFNGLYFIKLVNLAINLIWNRIKISSR